MFPRTLARIIFRKPFFVLRSLYFDFYPRLKGHRGKASKVRSTKHEVLCSDMFIRINNRNNRAISRRIFALERKACFPSPAPENQLADAGAGGIYRHQRFALRRQILVERLNDEQLAPFERIVLHGRYYRPDYASELHITESRQRCRSRRRSQRPRACLSSPVPAARSSRRRPARVHESLRRPCPRRRRNRSY